MEQETKTNQLDKSTKLKADITQDAKEIYDEAYEWLMRKGKGKPINMGRLSQYATAVARWKQCEERVSEFGYLSPHPKTGVPTISPFVEISLRYSGEANSIWKGLLKEIQT